VVNELAFDACGKDKLFFVLKLCVASVGSHIRVPTKPGSQGI
jgi:hypothetical protein